MGAVASGRDGVEVDFMNKQTRRRLALLAGFIVSSALIFFLYPQKSLFPPLPEPNGYDVLVRVAATITLTDKSLKEPTSNQLTAFLVTNTKYVCYCMCTYMYV